MGNTPNNNFPYPESSGLVKDGWEDIKDLATSIDTKLGVYAPSTPGLTLINTTSFSGVSSQSISDVFSSTYANYKIVLSNLKQNPYQTISMRLRVSGSDNSTSNYYHRAIRATSTTFDTISANAQSSWDIRATSPNVGMGMAIYDITNPNLTANTIMYGNITYTDDDITAIRVFNGGFYFNDTTSFTGFTLIGSGNITGRVSVYGYNI
jgi:hypothetical protein